MRYADLPDIGNGLRLVGSAVMDEEQFQVEQWHLDRGEWRCTLDGLRRYAELRRRRREERKAAYIARQEREDEMGDWVEELQGRES